MNSVAGAASGVSARSTEALLHEINAVLRDAKDFHPAPTADINRRRPFDAKHRSEALENWLRAKEDQDATFSSLALLAELTRVYPRELAGLIVLALRYKQAGDREKALAASSRAMAIRPSDLHVQRVFSAISFWAGISNVDPEETEAYLKTRTCRNPFEHFETTPDGSVTVCCPSYLPVPIGNLNEMSAGAVWMSSVALELRRSVNDGSFSYCSRIHCGMISSKALPPRVSDPDPVAEVCPGDGATGSSALNLPKIVVLSHDRSCNLSCPSCRTDFFIAKKEEQDRLNRTLEDSVLPILKDAKSVWVTGSGDPFGSNHFRSLLRRINRKDYPRLLIDLHTNAQLFDERAWSDLELSGLVRQTEISIDAARPETYSVVRRGGNFQRLIENLRFIRSLRQAGEIQYLRFSFVVQALNFREMPAFAALGEEFCVDEISFNMIRNWGTFSADEFAENFIGGVQHPEHQEFLSVLEAPELRKPMVRLGNMRSYSASA